MRGGVWFRGHIPRPIRFKQGQDEQIPVSRDRKAYVLVWREVMIIKVSDLGYGFPLESFFVPSAGS